MDKCLLFGLRSAPFLFNMVADALEWILCYHFHQQHCFHYLDDFFFAIRCLFSGTHGHDSSARFSWSTHKTMVGPTTCLPLLDTVQ